MSPEEQAVELEYTATIYGGVLKRCAGLINAQIDEPIDLLVCLTSLTATLIHTRFVDPIERRAALACMTEYTYKLIQSLEERRPDAEAERRSP